MTYAPLWLAERICNTRLGGRLARHASRRRRVYETLESIITALVVFVLLQAFVVQAYEIPSGSMMDTLLVGDRILVNKFYYWFEPPTYGDIVVFKVPDEVLKRDPGKPYYIKRLIGKPGDMVEVRDGKLYISDKLLDTRSFFLTNVYFNDCNGKDYRKETVPEGQYYVFGDNSDVSLDSRAWGGVPVDNVIGKAVFRFWPLRRVGLIKDKVNTEMPSYRSIPDLSRIFHRPSSAENGSSE